MDQAEYKFNSLNSSLCLYTLFLLIYIHKEEPSKNHLIKTTMRSYNQENSKSQYPIMKSASKYNQCFIISTHKMVFHMSPLRTHFVTMELHTPAHMLLSMSITSCPLSGGLNGVLFPKFTELSNKAESQ